MFNNNYLNLNESTSLIAAIEIKAKIEGVLGSFDHTLKISPIFDDEKIEMKTYNNENLGFRVELPNYVKSFDYSLIIDGAMTKCNYVNENFIKGISDDIIITSLIPKMVAGNLEIKIFNLELVNAYGGTFNYQCNNTVSVNNLFYSGSGEENDPYLINTYRHFYNLRYTTKKWFYYKLITDIDCSGHYDWRCIPSLYGVFDGNDHKIIGENYKIAADKNLETKQGLFSINYATIKNLTIVNCGINMKDEITFEPKYATEIGMFCGINYGSILNCKYDSKNETIIYRGTYAFIGGIAGTNSGTISDCIVHVSKMDCYGNCGLIVGYNDADGKIINCTVKGEIVNHYYDVEQEQQYAIGGITGINYGEVRNCINYANVGFYLKTPCDSRLLQPRIGTIIGANHGVYAGCQSSTIVNKTGLQIVKWHEGKLWWRKDYEHNQALYCGNICGLDDK